jgi:hypothetical protein
VASLGPQLPSLRNRAKRVAIPCDPQNPGTLPPPEIRERIGQAVKQAIQERFPTSPVTTCLFYGLVGARLASEVTGTRYRFQAGLATQLDDGAGQSYTANHCWFAAGHPPKRERVGTPPKAGIPFQVEFVDLSALAWPEPRFIWGWTPEVFEPLTNYKVERLPRLIDLTEAELGVGLVKSWYKGRLLSDMPVKGIPALLFDQVYSQAAELAGLPLVKPWRPWSREQREINRLESKLAELCALDAAKTRATAAPHAHGGCG